MTFCRSDPLLQRKKAGLSSEARGHGGATRSGEPYTQGAPVSDALQYQMIGLPPSDYIAKPPPAATTDKVIITMLTTIHAFIEHKMNSDNKFQKFWQSWKENSYCFLFHFLMAVSPWIIP